MKAGVQTPISIQPGNTPPGHTVDETELSTNECFAVGQSDNGVYCAIAVQFGYAILKGHVGCSIRVDAREAARIYSEVRKSKIAPGKQCPSIGQESQSVSDSVQIMVTGVLASIWIKPCASFENLAIRLNHESGISEPGNKVCVEAPVPVKPRTPMELFTIDAIEVAGDQNFAIRLNGDVLNVAITVRT